MDNPREMIARLFDVPLDLIEERPATQSVVVTLDNRDANFTPRPTPGYLFDAFLRSITIRQVTDYEEPGDILDRIDSAVDDWERGPDAFRYVPEGTDG